MQSRAIGPLWVLICLIACVPVAAADVQIYRAERVTIPSIAHSEQSGKNSGPARVSFDALGRRFDLELQSNERLLSKLPPAQRAGIDGRLEVYRGRLAGESHSWVRLTRVGNESHGLIWDGKEFYSIAPLERVRALLVAPTAAKGKGDTVVYRAADTVIDLGPDFCAAVTRPGSANAMNGAQAFDSVLRELRSNSAISAQLALEIEVSLIADYEFFSRHMDAEGALLERFNIVDGIFSEQLGLSITAARLDVFTSPTDPFTTTDAGELLDQLANYRESHAALTAFGLTHLVTGRDLDGRTVGMGYIEGVCDPFAGTSLSSDMTFDVTMSALIAAHELGHNFGAEHDDEPGSVCASTPDGYLMAPVLNGSSTFSQCSLDTMTPVIDAAPCIFPAEVHDVAVTPVEPTDARSVRQPFTVGFDVSSIGTGDVDGVEIEIYTSGYVTLDSATLQGGTCTTADFRIRCEAGTFADDDVRRLSVTMTSAIAGDVSVTARVLNVDDDPDNNSAELTLAIDPRVDVALSMTSVPSSGTVGEPITAVFLATVDGIEAAGEVTAYFSLSGFTVQSVTPDSGSCPYITDYYVQCGFGTLATGTQRAITLRLVPIVPGTLWISGQVDAAYDDTHGNESVQQAVLVVPTMDLRLTTGTNSIRADVGVAVPVAFELTSAASLPVADAVVDISVWYGREIVALTAEGGVCSEIEFSTHWRCGFGTLEPGVTRRVEVAVQGNEVGVFDLVAVASAPDDQDAGNSQQNVAIELMQPRDLAVEPIATGYAYDGRRFQLSVYVSSRGRTATPDASVEVALPDAISAISAEPSQGDCLIAAGLVECALGVIEPGAYARIDLELEAREPGLFYGTAAVSSEIDGDASNDQVTVGFDISPARDVAVTFDTVPPGVVGRSFEVPIHLVASTQPIAATSLQISSSSGELEFESATIDQGSCAISGSTVSCTVDPLAALGAATVRVQITARRAGFFSLYAEATTPGDIEWSNNYAQLEAEIDDPPPLNEAGGGGGGGGRIDAQWLWLALGLMFTGTPRRRRPASDALRQCG